MYTFTLGVMSFWWDDVLKNMFRDIPCMSHEVREAIARTTMSPIIYERCRNEEYEDGGINNMGHMNTMGGDEFDEVYDIVEDIYCDDDFVLYGLL